MRSAPNRLSIDDWIQQGYSLIAEEGLHALKIGRLCERLGVTKGSFYWHFTDMAGYRAALIDAWAAHRDGPGEVRSAENLPPRERLSAMVAALVGPRHWRLERAMREWARTDQEVATAVSAADRLVLRSVRQAFIDLGFAPAAAELRAQTTFAAGVGFLQIAGSRPQPLSVAQRERFLDLMARP